MNQLRHVSVPLIFPQAEWDGYTNEDQHHENTPVAKEARLDVRRRCNLTAQLQPHPIGHGLGDSAYPGLDVGLRAAPDTCLGT